MNKQKATGVIYKQEANSTHYERYNKFCNNNNNIEKFY